MTTKLTRPVTRETADRDPVWGRLLMVRLEEGGRMLRIWQKSRRKKFTLTYAEIWRFAFQAYAKAALAERKAARAARKAERKK
jgi:hypothetical protein